MVSDGVNCEENSRVRDGELGKWGSVRRADQGDFSHPLPLSRLSSGTPKGVDFTAVRDLLLSVEGVEALHSLHIWALTVAQPVLSVHIAIGEWLGHSGRGEGARQPEH